MQQTVLFIHPGNHGQRLEQIVLLPSSPRDNAVLADCRRSDTIQGCMRVPIAQYQFKITVI